MTSEYLAAKTDDLESQTPVDPAQARAAQIPLEKFVVPSFPPEAFASSLNTLILTSDVKFDEYQSLLTVQPQPIPPLPPSITSLTLELFSLGYPPPFLTKLGAALPNIKSLTLYSQLLPGTTAESRSDALAFIQSLSHLQELHLLDVFAPEGFWPAFSESLGKSKSSGLRFLEVNFAYRHSDPDFLKGVPSAELLGLVKKGLLGLTLGISEPDVSAQDEDDREGTEEGVLVKSASDGKSLVEKLVREQVLSGLIMCDLTMFELDRVEVETVLEGGEKVKVLGLAVALEEGWDEIFKLVSKKERGFEFLELVGVPGVGLVEKLKTDTGKEDQLTREQLKILEEKCKDLKSVKVSILRTRVEQWVKEGETWSKK